MPADPPEELVEALRPREVSQALGLLVAAARIDRTLLNAAHTVDDWLSPDLLAAIPDGWAKVNGQWHEGEVERLRALPSDLAKRLTKAAEELDVLSRSEQNEQDCVRLQGKRQGLLLALDYLRVYAARPEGSPDAR